MVKHEPPPVSWGRSPPRSNVAVQPAMGTHGPARGRPGIAPTPAAGWCPSGFVQPAMRGRPVIQRALTIDDFIEESSRGRGRGVIRIQAGGKLVLTIGHVDDTITRSYGILARTKGGHGAAAGGAPDSALETVAAARFGVLGADGTLILDGHGASRQVGRFAGPAEQFGGYTATALATLLVQRGLPADFRGKIYLNGCNTATGLPDEQYIVKFQQALSLRGFLGIRVKGNAGESQVTDQGRTRVKPKTDVAHDAYDNASEIVTGLTGLRTLASGLRPGDGSRDELAGLMSDLTMLHEIGSSLVPQITSGAYSHDKALRPTLPGSPAISHYEQATNQYTQLPAELGRNGKTLRRTVQDALRAYDRAFKFSQSQASIAAVRVLTTLTDSADRFPQLLMAVRYYLRRGPKPPVQLVDTGAQLTAGTRFDGLLSAAYTAWE